ncbi:glutamate receptor 4 [Nematostella vectensis]|uniref:glutamate receptor 4 n=1 Tax=Nematostella vectensis TaxID=45351 RepID=UPI002077718E|nr:glutamate receptor 4 [Nematostella vectensis]
MVKSKSLAILFYHICAHGWLSYAAVPPTAYIAFFSEEKDQQSRAAVQSAINQVNSDTGLLASTTLRLVEGTENTTSLAYAANLTSHGALAILTDSQPSPSLDLLSAMLAVPMVTTQPIAANSTLSKRGISLAPSRDDVLKAIADIVKHYKWSSLLVLSDVRWSEQARRLHSLLPSDIEKADVNIVLDYPGKLYEETKSVLNKLNNKLVEAIILLCDAKYVSVVMDGVHSPSSRVVERSHNWILADMLPSFNMIVEKSQIVVGLTPSISANQHTTRLTSDLSTNETTTKNSSYFLYDSVLTFAHALDDVIKSGRWVSYSPVHNVEKSKNAITVLDTMKKIKVVGTTGQIHFSSEGERGGEMLDVMNLRSSRFIKVGTWNSTRLVSGSLESDTNQDHVVIPLQYLNRKLKVVLVEDPPFVFSEVKDGTRHYTGYSIDLITKIAELLSFKFYIVESPDGKYGGRNPDGSFNGIVGELQRQRCDMSVSPLTINSGRLEYLSFAKPFMQFSMDLITRQPEPKGVDILAFMMPYSIPVWLMTFACLAFMTLMLTIINYFSPFGHRLGSNDGTGEEFTLFNSLWFSLASTLQQGPDDTPKCLSGRVIVGCFWFCVLIWVSTYTANLAAFFQASSEGHTVQTLKEVLDGDYNLHILSDTALQDIFRVSEFSLYSALYKRMVSRKLFVNSSSQGFDLVRADKKNLFMDENPFSEYLIMQKPCDLAAAKGFMGAQSYGIALPKGSPYTNNISMAILQLQEIGFLEELRRKWWDYRSQCRTSRTEKTTDRLGMEHMAGLYTVLAVGCVIGMLSTLGEIWWSKKGEKVKEKMKSVMPQIGWKKKTKVEAFDGDK